MSSISRTATVIRTTRRREPSKESHSHVRELRGFAPEAARTGAPPRRGFHPFTAAHVPYNELPPPLREMSLAVADAVLAVLQSVSNSTLPKGESKGVEGPFTTGGAVS